MVHSTLKPAEDGNTSKLYMWRCVVAMAHADGMIQAEEDEWLRKTFINMRDRAGLPLEHYDILLSDLEEPQDVANLLPYINDPAYRAQVVYFARLLAYKDGVLQPSEEQLLEKLHASVTDGLPMDAIREEVASNVQHELVLHEVEKDSARPMTGLSGLLDQLFLHFGIDLMDD